jgi:RNA polymerase sigma-70 factor (ECF subfamily)
MVRLREESGMGSEDAKLLERLGGGDEAALEDIFVRHYGTVYRVLYHLLCVHEWAEDLAQETFLELYRNPPAHLTQDSGTLSAWLCRVALNRGYNALRGDARARKRMERAASLDSPGEARHADPAVEVLRVEERSQVRETLARLPERQGKLLLLRHAGLSYAECAAVLDVASSSIGTLLARAESAFRDAYRAIEGAHSGAGGDLAGVAFEPDERRSQ